MKYSHCTQLYVLHVFMIKVIHNYITHVQIPRSPRMCNKVITEVYYDKIKINVRSIY